MSRVTDFVKLQIAGWACMYLLLMVAALPNVNEPGIFRFNSVACLLLCVMSFGMHPICRTMGRETNRLLALAPRVFAVCAVAGSVVALAAELFTFGRKNFDRSEYVVSAVQCTVILFLWASVYFVIKQWQTSTHERELRLKSEAELRDAKLSALRYQLNPHFLFNSLNAVSTLYLEEDAEAATDMLAQVCDLLRVALNRDTAATVPLSQEIDFIKKYLSVERTRLGRRLNIHMDIAPETIDLPVPNMLLQPLVENAVRHGIAAVAGSGCIAIASATDTAWLTIEIKNSGPLHSDERTPFRGTGIGLTNTVERLKTLYDDNYRFNVIWPIEGGCQVTIRLPCLRR